MSDHKPIQPGPLKDVFDKMHAERAADEAREKARQNPTPQPLPREIYKPKEMKNSDAILITVVLVLIVLGGLSRCTQKRSYYPDDFVCEPSQSSRC